MDLIPLKVITCLISVIALMYIVLKLIQKYGKFGLKLSSSGSSMKIDGTIYIDESTKIICLSRMGTNYMLAINKNYITVIDKYESEK